MIRTTENRYNGVIIDSSTLPENIDNFKKEVLDRIDISRAKDLLWIEIPIDKSEFIPILTNMGFKFHHCDETHLTLLKKLKQSSIVPTSKNFIAGVGAIVMKEGQLLVVKDRFSSGYKLPGGHIDKNESIKSSVKREVYEETGINIEFESIMNLGHFKNGQFGESNLYIVCTAKALSDTIVIHDTTEIIEAKWMRPDEFLSSTETNNYNKSVVQAALNNSELKLTERHVKLRVPDGEVFF